MVYILLLKLCPPPLPASFVLNMPYTKFFPILHGTGTVFSKNKPFYVSYKDDPGTQDVFIGGGLKNFEQICNHSQVGYSVMFCVRWV